MSATSLSTFSAYLEAQVRLGGKPGSPLPAITISRECGAGAVGVANIIAETLNAHRKGEESPPWTVFDRNLAERVLVEHELSPRVARFMPEDVTAELKAAFEEFLGLHPSNWTLLQYTNETILRLARAGNAIIVGRGGNVVTRTLNNVFHVRLVAPIGFRVQQMKKM